MRALTIVLAMALCACGATVRPDQVDVVTKAVGITQREYVEVPADLVTPLPVYLRKRETPGEWWAEAEHNTTQLLRCNRDRAASALLSGQPVD